MQILFGVSQDSVLGPILLNIFLSGLFLVLNDIDIASHANDNTLYEACENVDAVAKTLRMLAEKLFKWFKEDQVNNNNDKCRLILNKRDSKQIQIGIH